MLSNALLSFYRSARRQLLHTAINVMGLGIGIAVFITLMLVVNYEHGFDRWIPDADKIYRLDTTWKLPGQRPSELAFSSLSALGLLTSDFPQIESGARTLDQRVVVTTGAVSYRQLILYADADFLNVVRLPLRAGDRAQALAAPTSAVLTESTAMKYFGTPDVIGRTLAVGQGSSKQLYRVGAILKDLPPDTTFDVTIVLPMTPSIEAGFSHHLGATDATTWLRFAAGTNALLVASGLQAFVSRHATEGISVSDYVLSLVPLPDTHFHDVSVSGGAQASDPRIVFSLALVAMLALTTAIINYINLATAYASLRAREIALRKVVGATRPLLLGQFLAEAVILVALSALIGLALVELAVPVVNALGGWSIRVVYRSLLPLLAALTVGVGVGAGLYPAAVLSAYRPAAALAGSRASADSRVSTRIRSILVMIQFASAICIAICTLVIGAQADFVRLADRGFDQHGLILVLSLSAGSAKERQAAILNRFRQLPGVVAATASDHVPNDVNFNVTRIERPGMAGQQPSLVHETVAADYFRTYGITLLTGRTFDAAHSSDDMALTKGGEHHLGTIINERALSALGFATPQAALGHFFRVSSPDEGQFDLTIIGVVQNVRFSSPRYSVAPQFYLLNTRSIDNAPAVVRFSGVSRTDITERLQTALHEVAPEEPFRAQLVEDRLSSFYRPDEQRAKLFSIGSALAIFIACLGLYGLAAFSSARRVKEIGIRKVLGASTRDVLLLVVGQFVRPVLTASAIAAPLAWVLMRSWLSGFDQRIELSPVYFLSAIFGALALSVVTVLGDSWRVARSEPAKALHYE